MDHFIKLFPYLSWKVRPNCDVSIARASCSFPRRAGKSKSGSIVGSFLNSYPFALACASDSKPIFSANSISAK